MHPPRPVDVLFWALALVAAGLFGLFVLVLAGALPVEPVAQPRAAVTRAAPGGAPEPPSTTGRATERAPSTPAAPLLPPARLTTVVVTAARGACWLSARVDSEEGRVLDERVLRPGESVRLRAQRVWLALGAAAHVDVLVDGEPQAVPPGTVELVLGARAAT